jgi:plastocyanin
MRLRTLSFVAIVAGAACGNPTYGGGGGGGGGQGGHTTSITVGNAGSSVFSPRFDTVAVSSTVTWTWGSGPHTVTFEALNDSSASMSSGTFLVTFSTPGTYRYRCLIHSTAFGSGMSGSITVQ